MMLLDAFEVNRDSSTAKWNHYLDKYWLVNEPRTYINDAR